MVEARTFSKSVGRKPVGKWGNSKFAPKRKVCAFCANRSKSIDYKDTSLLVRFISDRGKIEPRRRTGTCNRHQHAVALAIKQARHIALLPFVPVHIHLQGIVPPLNLNIINPAPVEPIATQSVPNEEVQTEEATVIAETVIENEPEVVVEANQETNDVVAETAEVVEAVQESEEPKE